MPTIIEQPTETTQVAIEEEIKTLESEERQTIVHCVCKGEASEAYRIWPSTYLVDVRNSLLLLIFRLPRHGH